MSLNLRRETKCYISTVESAFSATNTFEVPILADYSFTQSTGSETITLNEAGAAPSRGQRAFNIALEQVELSLPAYIRPYIATNHNCVENILWEGLVGAGPIGTNVVDTLTELTIDYANSDVHEILKLYVYLVMENSAYKITEAVVNTAEVDFSIDSIGMITWGLLGKDIVTYPVTGSPTDYPDPDTPGTTYLEVPAGANFIKNKLSTITLVSSAAQGSTSYNIPITGGNLSFENNITFLTPEELGRINSAIGHFTGTRSISGSLTCYLNTGAGNSEALFDEIATDTTTITHEYDMTFHLGGPTAPKVDFDMPLCHLTIPSIQSDDVISLNMDFTALGSSITATDEATIVYTAV